jgi:hypothetical protein
MNIMKHNEKISNSKKVYWQLRPLSIIHGGVTTMQPID